MILRIPFTPAMNPPELSVESFAAELRHSVAGAYVGIDEDDVQFTTTDGLIIVRSGEQDVQVGHSFELAEALQLLAAGQNAPEFELELRETPPLRMAAFSQKRCDPNEHDWRPAIYDMRGQVVTSTLDITWQRTVFPAQCFKCGLKANIRQRFEEYEVL